MHELLELLREHVSRVPVLTAVTTVFSGRQRFRRDGRCFSRVAPGVAEITVRPHQDSGLLERGCFLECFSDVFGCGLVGSGTSDVDYGGT